MVRHISISSVYDSKSNNKRIKSFWKRQNFAQARAIVDYRRVCGTLTNLREQLSLSKDFTTDDFSRLEPYVEY